MNSDEKTQKRKKRIRIALIVVLAILVIFAGLACYASYVYRTMVVKPDAPKPPEVVVTPPPVAVVDPDTGEEVIPDPIIVEKVNGDRKSEDFYTILVVGIDVVSNRTDTILLVSYNVTNQKATVMSIPRDTLVNAFGTTKYTRINKVYTAFGRGDEGKNALTREVAELVGFVPDYRVFIDWELVGQMVDAIGGVEYDVPFHMEYDDPTQDLHIYVEKGLQVLDGEKAMQLVRWRKNNKGVSGGGDGSDLNRLKVQQGFLKAVLKQTLQIKNLTKISDLVTLFAANMEGDLTVENLLWFAKEAVFGGLAVESVEFVTMPWKAANPYVYPDQEKLLALINSKLNPFNTEVTIDKLDLIYFDEDGNLCATGELNREKGE